MTRFKVSLKRHISNLSYFISILVGFIGLSCYFYSTDSDIVIFYLFGGIFLIFFSPVIIIHLNYWIEDFRKIVQIDFNNKTINVKKGKENLTYNFKDIKTVILTTQGAFNSQIKNYRIPWVDYFYYQIDLRENDKLILTSLILKRIDFPFKVNYHKCTFIPIISSFDYNVYVNDATLKYQAEIDKFKLLYKNYSKNELEDIINSGKYIDTAVEAANELLKTNTFANTRS